MNSALGMWIVCGVSWLASAYLQAAAPPAAGSDSATIQQRERAAEPLYQAALAAAKDRRAQAELLDAIAAALKAGACPTRTLTEKSFASLHGTQRFRELIRDHARQSEIVLVIPGEPGTPLRVAGRVTGKDGKPVPGALVYVYHTDARGYYSDGGMEEANPRIFGYLRTDQGGRYAFGTIRPAAYAIATEEEPVDQHMHMIVTAPNHREREHRIGFADDPFWQGKSKPRWVVEVAPAQGESPASCEFNVVLETAQER